MKTIRITTQASAKETFKRFGLKGITKIRTEQDVLDALENNDLNEWAELYQSIIDREGELKEKYREKCKALAEPNSPLKGRGYQRREVELIPSWVTKEHRTEVTRRRKGGFFGSHSAVSPEAYSLMIDYANELTALNSEWSQKTPHEEQEDVLRAKQDQAMEVERQKQREAMQAKLSEMTGEALVREFFKNETHPAPSEVIQFKELHGLTWSQLRTTYK